MGLKKIARGLVLSGILAGALCVSAAADFIGVGTVSGDGLRLRSGAGTDHAVLATANEGDTVLVMEDAGVWYKVDFGTQVGYMSAGYVDLATTVEADLGLGMVTTKGDALNVRGGAGTGFEVVTRISNGTVVDLTGMTDGWYKITYNNTVGYVSGAYITPVLDANGTRKDGAVAQDSQASGLGQRIVDEAMKHVGKRYVYGAKGPNAFDCSGFAYYCVKQASGGSILLAGGSTNQWRSTPGQRITSISQLQPGDLFFICDPAYSGGKATSHVAIYAGNGNLVHASDAKTGVIVNPIKDKDRRYFVGAIRLG